MKILVIGETCTDSWIHCRVDRICPEAPVIVANPLRTTENYGMAANVRANLVSLGAVEARLISQNKDIFKTRYVEEHTGHMLIRIDENDRAETAVLGDLLATIAAEEWDAIVISDYNKGFLDEDAISEIANRAKIFNVPTFLDTKKLLDVYSRAITFVKINKREYDTQMRATGRPTDYCENLIVTLGEKGSWWVNKDIIVPVEPVNVSDLSGAGDTYISAFVLKYLVNGYNVYKAMEYANRAARIAVSKRGIVAVSHEELDE